MVKKQTEIEILRACKEAQGFKTDSEFAEALGIQRQKLWNWLNDVNKPSTDVLKLWALVSIMMAPWRARLAIALLKARGMENEIPCTCERSGNSITNKNPFCPRHFEELQPVGVAEKNNGKRPNSVAA